MDPIDGTVNYLYGMPYYARSLAAEVDGEVVAGVVHNVATGVWWTAVAGGGAYRDGHRLAGSTETELSQALVATGFGYDARRRAHQAAGARRAGRPGPGHPPARAPRALDLCLAAAGRRRRVLREGPERLGPRRRAG